ncbi:hypothetical protein [Campylobacter hominis]|uniref:Uncharacterized protein n=1 Tax=Campylobacter hominis (strain ATCC BAA-381 / DSM 21671 / CCUG 45161 / LMG 19568 / NCTC 13146 / CH001A) TaxID=360107 RepID=A7I3I3_CAMHC|nr:hypothetical protein [Campylobacter hominis]ABS51974.1 conserved hypothetical protein [Campylobacter hominis ATCC BAA-381]UAK85711.1 SirA-like protein [Campylobacter hominis]SUW85588.1 Predicted transporter component [Campylobacter hominis]
MSNFYGGEATYTLDLQAAAYPPSPVALNPKKLKVLELIYNYPQSINSIPYDAKNRGFEILSVEQDETAIRFIIKHL